MARAKAKASRKVLPVEIPPGERVPDGITLMLMQNQWFRRVGPDTDERQIRRKAILDKSLKWSPDPKNLEREWHVKQYLFMGCLTGKRLRRAFPEASLFDDNVVFEEVSTRYGWEASFNPGVDTEHVRNVLRKHRPSTIVVFGQVARRVYFERAGLFKAALIQAGCHVVNGTGVRWILAPHPAGRFQVSVMKELLRARDVWLGGRWDATGL